MMKITQQFAEKLHVLLVLLNTHLRLVFHVSDCTVFVSSACETASANNCSYPPAAVLSPDSCIRRAACAPLENLKKRN